MKEAKYGLAHRTAGDASLKDKAGTPNPVASVQSNEATPKKLWEAYTFAACQWVESREATLVQSP